MRDIAQNELSQIYKAARASVIKAQHTVYTAVNSAMVTAYKSESRYIKLAVRMTGQSMERV